MLFGAHDFTLALKPSGTDEDYFSSFCECSFVSSIAKPAQLAAVVSSVSPALFEHSSIMWGISSLMKMTSP